MDGTRCTFFIYNQSQFSTSLVIISNIFAWSLGLNGLDFEGWPLLLTYNALGSAGINFDAKRNPCIAVTKLFWISYRHYKYFMASSICLTWWTGARNSNVRLNNVKILQSLVKFKVKKCFLLWKTYLRLICLLFEQETST